MKLKFLSASLYHKGKRNLYDAFRFYNENGGSVSNLDNAKAEKVR